MSSKDVVVVIGVGDMGIAIARRVGAGRKVVLADHSATVLATRVAELTASGYDVDGVEVDVSSASSVDSLTAHCAGLGPVRNLVHTAGLSPVQASVPAILAVDLLGTALVIDAFGAVIADGGSGLAIASMAAELFPAPAAELARALAVTPAAELLALPALQPEALDNSGVAYALAKQANIVRVAASSKAWGARGATLNAISPGVISTAMGREELAGESGEIMLMMIAGSGTGRVGTPDDIAAAAEFLLSPAASFITGANLLVDGGVCAATKFG